MTELLTNLRLFVGFKVFFKFKFDYMSFLAEISEIYERNGMGMNLANQNSKSLKSE